MKFFALIAAASAIQLKGDFFEAKDNGTGPLDKIYERVIPERYATGNDDLFMRSMITSYAREGKNADGSPNGVFTMTEAETKRAASEVLGTHLKMDGDKLKSYIDTYFPRTWAHYDPNGSGAIAVETAPIFMRFLASDQTLQFD